MNKKIFLWILVIAWMTAIFCLSAQPAPKSSKTSLGVITKFLTVVSKTYRELSPDEQKTFAESFQHIVRKAAHFTEYAILGVLCFFAVKQHFNKKRYIFSATALICLLYASSDEIHQLFIPGRSGQLSDTMIDFAGSLTGMFFAFLLLTVFVNLREKSRG